MNIDKLINLTQDIELYDKGTGVMWTDEYISGQLLKAHIDSSNDLASRNGASIEQAVDWIAGEFGRSGGAVLDIGCGPGLYTERLAAKGYSVTGVDFSENSIEYAKNSAKEKQLNIEYFCMDYLMLDFHDKADLIIMIYCDFCVMSSSERDILLQNIYRALKPGGKFIFDVQNETAFKCAKDEKSWEFSSGGFWQAEPYLLLTSKQLYKERKIVLNQHIVIDEENECTTYHFWEHFYNEGDIKSILESNGFANVKSCGNFLINNEFRNENGITFYRVTK